MTIAKPLVKEAGIGSIILENPYCEFCKAKIMNCASILFLIPVHLVLFPRRRPQTERAAVS